MSWFDDYGAATNATKSTIPGSNIFYDKKFLETVQNELLLVGYGQQRPLPEGEGKTAQFFRWLNLAISTSAATLTEGVNPDATVLKGQDIQAVIAEYGAFAQLTSLLKQEHIDTNVEGAAMLFGEHAATIIDLLTHYQVASNGAYPVAADDASTSRFSGVVDSATATTLVDAVLTTNTGFGDANDDLNQCVVIITAGDAYGQARAASDYVTASGTITVGPAWDVIPVAGDTYVAVSPDELVAADDLSYSNVKRARTLLKKFKARTFAGGAYVAVVSPDMASGLMDDTDWKNIQENRTDQFGIFRGEIGSIAGVRFVEETNPYTFPIVTRGTVGSAGGVGVDGANYSSTAVISACLVLGMDAFGVTTFRRKGGQLPKPKMIIKTPGKNDTSNPLNRYGTVGWALEFVAKALNPLHAVQIWNHTG